MILRLAKLPKAPLTSDEFMTDFDVQYRTDITLARGIKAVLPQIMEYLGMDDSQNVPKELTHDTRNMAKELSDDNRDIDKDLVDDSRHVLKDRAPRMVEWGYNIKVVPIGSGSTPRTTPSTLPALEALVQMTQTRVLMEEADDSSNDDEAPVIKMEVDPPLKIKGKGTAEAPMDLTSDSDSDKENDRIYPGPTWMRYDRNNPEHYRIDIPEGDMTSTTLFIHYMFNGEETILEGCDGKQTPIYRKALHVRSADTRPNLRDDKMI